MDIQPETAESHARSSAVESREVVLNGLRQAVSEIDDVAVLQRFGEEVIGVVEAKKASIEQRDWETLEGLAAKHGHQSVASWMARRGVVLPSTEMKKTSRRRRDFSEVEYWVHPIFKSYSIKLGKRPAWVGEHLRQGYTEGQLSAPKGSYSDTKGQAYWVDINGDYWLNTRPSIPKRIQDLLDADKDLSLVDLSRPPGSFSQESGHCPPSELPPRIPDLPEPAGEPREKSE